jgi:hypothetical protein
MDTKKQQLEQGLKFFEEIYAELENLDNDRTDQELQGALELAIERCGRALDFYQENNHLWTAAWVRLRQASLHCEMAEGANYMGRGVQVHAAMTLIKDVLDQLPDLPPNLDLTAKIYIAMTETLFHIRSLFDKADQLEAIDSLIRVVSENLGESLALDLLYRAEANDLEFAAGVLESLVEADMDPDAAEELILAANDFREQVKALHSMTSTLQRTGGEK